MESQLLHIFRNNPLGRETLMQSIHFCRCLEILPVIYVPSYLRFLMYFDNDVVQVDLDDSYLTAPQSAHAHLDELMGQWQMNYRLLEPEHFTASTLPDLPTDFDFMCCPRSVSDVSSKIGLGYIGSRVRRIVKSARFPVLLTGPAYKEWRSIAVFFGGSVNAIKSLRLALRLCRLCKAPLDIFTQLEKPEAIYRGIIAEEKLEEELNQHLREWYMFSEPDFAVNLYAVPSEALVVVGAYGHGLIKDLLFGSKMEMIHSQLPNNMLVVGPHYAARS